MRSCLALITLVTVAFLVPGELSAQQQADKPVDSRQFPLSHIPIDAVPELREEDHPLKFEGKKDRNFFVVPIPMSSPTFGSGLVLGGAYFYQQSEEQKKTQPASFTGAAAAYTHNKSWFAGVMQQNYFKEDTWRFGALAAYADFKLELVPPPEGSEESLLDWLVDGGIFMTSVSRRIGGDWFLGLSARYLDIQQDLDLETELPDFNPDESIRSPGIGLNLQYDSRDVPSNAYSGQRFELKAVFADQRNVSDGRYDTYSAKLSSYHHLNDPLVLAWEVNACSKEGRVPLWDTCRLSLRGFPVTQYLSMQSIQGQAELRWRFYKRWGVVAFAGAGRVYDSLGGNGEDETIPSYGVGLRWMVLESQRINVRVDYARSSDGSDAWYLSVMEAF